jgi:hypothetical protein
MGYQQWLKHHPQWAFIDEDWPGNLPVLKQGTTTIHSLKCTNFELADYAYDGSVVRRSLKGGSDYAATTETIADEKACHVFERTINAPQVPGLPMMLVLRPQNEGKTVGMKYNTGAAEHFLSLLSMKTSQEPNSLFQAPPNCQTVKREVDVVSDAKRLEDIKDIMLDH